MEGMKCPNCSADLVLLGEGGYGRCTNDQCRIKVKIDQCDVPSCDDLALEEETNDEHEMKD